ncbi:hypothetical protein [Cohnella abietis]|uniref:hypothetical protein n=1 Tax=Cohnella abietis TaxID=2507935 RepID=UPI0018D527E5|nr:hypothetical protein [Cohnella abietis]
MDTGTIATVISVAAAISGIIIGWSGRSRTIRHDTASDASNDATIRADMEYIKRGVDDVRLEQRAHGQRFDALSERVTRVEESAKQAHYRINRIEDQHN